MSYQNQPTNYKKRKKEKKIHLSDFLKFPPVDKNLLIVVLLLAVFGIVAIFSASAPEGLHNYEDPLHYPLRHLLFVAIGFVMMFMTSIIHYKNWERWVMPITITVILLIGATLVPGLGKTDYGSSRWLSFFPLQPSEFGKFACILLWASCLANAKSVLQPNVWKHAGIVALMIVLIFLQPNMSMVLILASTSLMMLIVAGMNLTIFISAVAILAPTALFFIMSTDYQRKRVMGWLDPLSDPQGIGWNIIQSWYAISSGGLLGVGIGNSKQKLYYLPVGYTDFIFSVIAEELGFVGIFVLVSLFLIFINIGFKIAMRCEDRFGKLLAFGITFIIGAQAFINMCVASGVFPVTGVTLPFISYGGSSFMVTTMMVGVLLNVSRYAIKERKTNNGKKEKQTA